MAAIRVENRSAYEFLLSLIVYATPQRAESYEVGAEWFTGVDSAASPDLKNRIARLTAGCEHLLGRLLDVAADIPPPGRADTLIDTIASLEAGELRLTLLGYYSKPVRRRLAAARILAAADGDRDAAREVIEAIATGPECERALNGLLVRAPEETAALLISTLRDWYEQIFRDLFAAVRPILDREAERLRGRNSEVGPDEMLREVSGADPIVPGPSIEEVAIFPTWSYRPLTVVWEHGPTLLVGAPVAPERISADPDVPPERLVAIARALGDERRLRILRRLTEGNFTLQELTEHFEVPKTTLFHHLGVLRAAGVVAVSPRAGGTYSLRPGIPLELHRLLDAYLPATRPELVGAGIDSRN